MASKKSLNDRIAEVRTRKEQYENHLKLLLNQQKEAERKARTHRLIERGALVESIIDGADGFTNEEVKTILTAALNSEAALEAIIFAQETRAAKEQGQQQGAGA